MIKWFKSQHHSILGIDISSTSVKILEISGTGDEHSVEGYGSMALPPHAIEGNVIKNIDEVANCIKKILTKEQLKCKRAALAVPDSAAISKVVQISDGLSDQEIEEVVIVEAEKYIPYPIEEINIDFEILGPTPKNSAMNDVLIVASRAENVNNRVEAITRAGLEAKVIDVESYAVERVAQLFAPMLPAQGQKKIIAIIDIGAVYTHLFVLDSMKIIFSREEEFGSKQLIDSMVQHYGMTIAAAAEAIERRECPPDYEDAVLNPFHEMILLQVKRTLQFFFSTSHHTFVDYILLAGGGAKQPGLDQLLQEQINIPTSVANPFAYMSLGKQVDRDRITRDSPTLIVACGLALRNAG